MNYYQVQFKSCSTGRCLNIDKDDGYWIRNESVAPYEKQTFNLRKVSENKFVLENNGRWIGLRKGSNDGYKHTDFLGAPSSTAGKQQAFEIETQPYLSDLVRIKGPNGFLVQFPQGSKEVRSAQVDFPANTRWCSESVFSLTIIKLKLENTYQNKNKGMPLDTAVLTNLRKLDGIKVQFRSIMLNKYLGAVSGGGSTIAANQQDASDREIFQLWGIPGTEKVLFQVSGGQFMGLDCDSVVAISSKPGWLEAFEIVQKDDDFTRVRIKAPNGLFLQARTATFVTSNGSESSNWKDDDSSVFSLTVASSTIPSSTAINAMEGAAQKLKQTLPPGKPCTTKDSFPTNLCNRELLDGTRIQFKSFTQQKYLCAERGGGNTIVANQINALQWETFKLGRVTEMAFQIQAFNGRFIGLEKQGKGNNVVANSDNPGKWEMFEIMRNANDQNHVRIKAPNGSFLYAKSDGSVTADFPSNRRLGTDDPSVFSLSIVTQEEWNALISRNDEEEEEIENTIKAVNLGGWLVTEGWIKPSLFNGITNKDLLDGTEVQLRSLLLNKYMSAQHGGGANIMVTASEANARETFKLWRISESSFQLRASKKQFIGLDKQRDDCNIVAMSHAPGISETFEIIRDTNDPMFVCIKAHNGHLLQVNHEGTIRADYFQSSDASCKCRDNDPSIFLMTIVNSLQGEFQLVNGYGTKKATEVMKEHWKSFIGEEDFEFISEHGLNAVRIPVGWWIASDPIPPWPFVGGSLHALDNAFKWAEKYDLGVIVSLYAAPGSQNGSEQSGARDTFQGWGKTTESIDQTVEVIDFLAARYANTSSLIGIELLDKPVAPGVALESLMMYYKRGYDTVRKHSSSAYVIMSNRLYADSKELLEFARGLKGSVINVHYYDFFSGADNTSLAAELSALTVPDGPPIFVGEWVAKFQGTASWRMAGAAKEDHKRFAKEKLEILGYDTFGWAYWTLKSAQKRWSFEWMAKMGYIA